MRKGQTFIVEFIMFFAIAFSLFSAISYYFYRQNVFFKKEVGEATSELINDFVSSNIMKSIGCKACHTILMRDDIPLEIGGYYYKVELNSNGLNTNLLSEKPILKQVSLFNLNKTFSLSGMSLSEDKKIGIKINNIDKNIEVE